MVSGRWAGWGPVGGWVVSGLVEELLVCWWSVVDRLVVIWLMDWGRWVFAGLVIRLVAGDQLLAAGGLLVVDGFVTRPAR